MLGKYVWAELVRNPRRTLSTMIGVTLGVGLSCSVLFFVDGLSSSITRRAVAPLAIDMQRVVTDNVAEDLQLTQVVDAPRSLSVGDGITVRLSIHNMGTAPSNEVIVRSRPSSPLRYVQASATIDGMALRSTTAGANAEADNPFASGPASAGHNFGVVPAGATVNIRYSARATAPVARSAIKVDSAYSTREAILPIAANLPPLASLPELVHSIGAIPGVAFVEPLSFVDLSPRSLTYGARKSNGGARVFGFNASYVERNPAIKITSGTLKRGGAVISAEVARDLHIGIGDTLKVELPDGVQVTPIVSGVIDLSRARALFASRKGADFETFVYVPNSIVVDQQSFATSVQPSFVRAATARGDRIKNPPTNEIEIGIRRDRLNAEPSVALRDTVAIGAKVNAVARQQDYLIDNISNALAVARDDAAVAKRMFMFLGVPAGLLAAFLAAYAGGVLAGAQRREQATLRIRGASRRHLLKMLVLRVVCIATVGSVSGVVLGFVAAAAVIGRATMLEASNGALLGSAAIGVIGGLVATGLALYLSGRRSLDQEINADRAELQNGRPRWKRWGIDLLGVVGVVVITMVARSKGSFEGAHGSVYDGQGVRLSLSLLLLPVIAWIVGSLLFTRFVGRIARGLRRSSTVDFARPTRQLALLSIRRRSWSIAQASLVVSLIVAIGASLSIFTASYESAKTADARMVVGSDVRITPRPSNPTPVDAAHGTQFAVHGVRAVSPVLYSIHNAVVRSRRTEEVTNLAAVGPSSFLSVAPVTNAQFPDMTPSEAFDELQNNPDAILVSIELADFIQAEVGDKLRVLVAKGTDQQAIINMKIAGLFDRLPGFPDGVGAVMSIKRHTQAVPSTVPNFFLAATTNGTSAGLRAAGTSLDATPNFTQNFALTTWANALEKDQSSIASLNVHGLIDLDSGFALAMGAVAMGVFVFGLLLQRRREYVTLRAQGMAVGSVRALICGEAGSVAVAGVIGGCLVGVVMARYFVSVLRPLFVLEPPFEVATSSTMRIVLAVLLAAAVMSLGASALVHRLRATELLRDV